MNHYFAMAECELQGYFVNRVQLGQIYSSILSLIDKILRL